MSTRMICRLLLGCGLVAGLSMSGSVALATCNFCDFSDGSCRMARRYRRFGAGSSWDHTLAAGVMAALAEHVRLRAHQIALSGPFLYGVARIGACINNGTVDTVVRLMTILWQEESTSSEKNGPLGGQPRSRGCGRTIASDCEVELMARRRVRIESTTQV